MMTWFGCEKVYFFILDFYNKILTKKRQYAKISKRLCILKAKAL